jgi:hypothetical protein
MRQHVSRIFHGPPRVYGSTVGGMNERLLDMPQNRNGSHDRDMSRPPVRDVADFHLRWREFRGEMVGLADNARLTPAQRETLLWLIRLADRVGARDLT